MVGRRQYSLRSAVVASCIVALVVCCLGLAVRLRQTQIQLAAANAQAARLEAALGIVRPGDRRRLHVLAVRQIEPMHWKWRVLAPPGVELELLHRSGRIPPRSVGVFDGTQWSQAPAGPAVPLDVETHVYRNPDGTWMQSLRINGGGSTVTLDQAMQDWLTAGPAFEANVAGQGQTQDFSPNSPIVLLRLLATNDRPVEPPAQPSTGESAARAEPGPLRTESPRLGLLVWLEVRPAPP